MEKFIHLDECDSTQDVLKEQLSIDESQSYIIGCEKQTKGHGRNGKIWNDSLGTICFSFNMPAHSKPSFSALEVSILIRKFFLTKNVDVKVKWPNDLINIHKKKCSGILIQNYKDQYLAGIGLNLYLDDENFGGIYESDFPIIKKEWIYDISSFILKNRYQDTNELIKDWNEGCIHLNKEVTITENEIATKGIFLGLGEYGEALINTDQGIQKIFNGSLRF